MLNPNANANFQPLEAVRAIRKLLEDPTDTEQAFRVVRAVDGGHVGRIHRRFAATPSGRSMLVRRPSLLAAIQDADALAAMPAGSLGRSYFEFCQREGLTPGGLIEVSESEELDALDADVRYVAERLRDAHDLWHVVTGCRTDLAGELGVLTFSTAQTGGVGVGMLAAVGYLRSYADDNEFGERGRALVREAWRIGRAACWLPAVEWETLLTKDLEEVRRELGVEPLADYEPVYADVALAA